MQHYENLDKDVFFTQLQQGKDLNELKQGLIPSQKLSAGDARTKLIKRHQLKKTLKQEMELLKKSTDEKQIKEYYQKLINFCIILAFEAINTNVKELDAIKYLETHNPLPPPPEEVKAKIIIQKKGKPEIFTIVGSGQPPAPAENPGVLGPTVPVQVYEDKKWQFHKDVFKPGFPQPTMTLEEYGDYEKERMLANTE